MQLRQVRQNQLARTRLADIKRATRILVIALLYRVYFRLLLQLRVISVAM